MTTSTQSRFDVQALKDLAGSNVFARGEAYYRDGLVEVLGIEHNRVLARVAGSEEYRTVVTGQATAIGGECSCPAFVEYGFCKHMVAVALAANATDLSDEFGTGSALKRVRDYLQSRDRDALVKIIMELAERDPALFRRMEAAAAMQGADDKTFKSQARKLIRDATATHGFIDYQWAREWADKADAVLDMLEEAASGPRSALVVDLADDAITAIERAMEDIDDSSGHCGMLLDRAQDIHFDACRNARPEPVLLARDLFKREFEDAFGTCGATAARYAEILGEEGLAEYYRLAQEAWDKLPAWTGRRRDPDLQRFHRSRLASMLDFFAERDGDVDKRIALRAKDLASQWAYLQLATFCKEHGRLDEALHHAEEGLWLFEDDPPDERLVSCAVDLLLNADRKSDAEAHLWRAFEKNPRFDVYARLRELGGPEAFQRARHLLEERLETENATRWYSPADLLIWIMIDEEMFDAAWNVVGTHGATGRALHDLARASEASHPDEALAVYAERVEDLAKRGGHAYHEAASLIAHMARFQGAAEREAYIADIRQRHGRKRNFMKLLR